MWSTMSISVGAWLTAIPVSAALISVIELPCGNPTTVPTSTSVPDSSDDATTTSLGRTHTDATWYRAARAQPSRISSVVSSGRNSEWSIIFAT